MAALRIASLLASGTEIVCALGLEDRLVGISHECDYPPRVLDRPRLSRPRFDPAGRDSGAIDRAVREAMATHGSVYEVDEAGLVRLAPTVILTQAVCEVCAVPTPGIEAIVRERGVAAAVVSLDAHTLDDIFRTILQVGAACGRPGRAKSVVTALRTRIEHVGRTVQGRPRPRVLALEWLDPPFVPGHWVPEMIERAGGACVAGRAGERSVEVPWDGIERLDPDVLIVMPCGYDLPASLGDADRFRTALVRVASRAVGAGRAYAVNGSAFFNRSGPRVADGIEILGTLLHPESGMAASAPESAARWTPGPV
ncbi:MAG: cobalamin-binding protein [Gemmatimonadota bacterium]|jgi:iron complex transport system substrate-binding protein